VESKTLSITKQVNRINGELVVSPPKTRNSVRTLALPQQAVDLLIAEHKKHPRNPYLFPSPKTGTMYDPDAFRRTHDKILKAIGAEHIRFHDLRHPYVKPTTKIFSLRLMDFQAQAYPDAQRKTRGACQLHRGGQSRSTVRPLYNRKRFSCLPPQSKMSWILYAISMRLSGYTSTRSISISASSVVSASASKIALDASFRLSCRACSSCFCFACANTAA
jgi:integrase